MNLMGEVRAGARAMAERAVHVSIDQTAVEVGSPLRPRKQGGPC